MTFIVLAVREDGTKSYLWDPSLVCSPAGWDNDQKGAWAFADRASAYRAAKLARGWYDITKVVKLVPRRPQSEFVELMRGMIR